MALFIYEKVDKGLELSGLTNSLLHYYLRVCGGFCFILFCFVLRYESLSRYNYSSQFYIFHSLKITSKCS